MRTALLLAFSLMVLAASPGTRNAAAQTGTAAPVYMRSRGGDRQWHGGGFNFGGYPPSYGFGYFQPYLPYAASSWYARPYPYHFDYFRGRWDRAQPAEALSLPAGDCPCSSGVESPAALEVVPPAN